MIMYLSYYDIILTPIYLIGLFFIVYLLRYKLATQATKDFYYLYFGARMLSAVIFALVYQFYYKGGDTFLYYEGGNIFLEAFKDDPLKWLEMMFQGPAEISPRTYMYTIQTPYFDNKEEWVLTKVTAVVTLLGSAAYIPMALLFSFWAFLGTWLIYKVFAEIYPHHASTLGWVMLFIPSSLFWCSGILKDTFVIGAHGIFTYSLFRLVKDKSKVLQWLVILVIMGYLIQKIKAYVIITFLPAALVWTYAKVREQITHWFLKLSIIPFLLLIVGGLGYYSYTAILAQNNKYASFESVTTRIAGFQYDHLYINKGSSYSLGEFDFTPGGLVSVIPAAINVSLFRPYPWEARNAVVLLMSVESILCFFVFLITLYRTKVFGIFKKMNNPEVLMCLIFTLLLGYIVGITSYNFGVLTRFKAPLMPFFTASLVLMWQVRKKRVDPKDKLIEQQLKKIQGI